MNEKLKVAIFQADCTWENPQANIDRVKTVIENSAAELVILPEMFATGFSMSPAAIAQKEDGLIVTSMRQLAVESKKAIIFSAAIEDNGKYYNRLFFIHPHGSIESYNKRHLFRMAGEDKVYQSGRERLVVNFKGFKICPLVCYDLRFPVFSRNNGHYDVLVYIASWPHSRSHPWATLLPARAIENQCYCIGVNRVGSDPKNSYSGLSMVLNFKGESIAAAEPFVEELVECELSLGDKAEFIKSFPAYMDADDFTIL